MATTLPACAQDAIGSCTEVSMVLAPPSDLRLARVTGHSRVYLLSEDKGCPRGGQACRTGEYLRPGDVVVVGGREITGRLCIAHPGRATAVGWTESSRFEFIQSLASPALGDWAGTWTEGDSRINLSVVGDHLQAAGDAYWPRRGDPNGHEGHFTSKVTPGGATVSFTDEDEEDCNLRLVLLGPVLAVSDNLMCGGANVSFRGLYLRR